MKITKARLRQIIKEELQNVLNTKRRVNEAFPSSLDDVFPSIKGDDEERAEELARQADRQRNQQGAAGDIYDPQADLDRAEREAREADRRANPQDPYGNIPQPPTPPTPAPVPPPPPRRNLGPVFYRKLLNTMGPKDLQRYGRNRRGRGQITYDQWIAARRALAKGGVDALNNWVKNQAPGLERLYLDTVHELSGNPRKGQGYSGMGGFTE